MQLSITGVHHLSLYNLLSSRGVDSLPQCDCSQTVVLVKLSSLSLCQQPRFCLTTLDLKLMCVVLQVMKETLYNLVCLPAWRRMIYQISCTGRFLWLSFLVSEAFIHGLLVVLYEMVTWKYDWLHDNAQIEGVKVTLRCQLQLISVSRPFRRLILSQLPQCSSSEARTQTHPHTYTQMFADRQRCSCGGATWAAIKQWEISASLWQSRWRHISCCGPCTYLLIGIIHSPLSVPQTVFLGVKWFINTNCSCTFL